MDIRIVIKDRVQACAQFGEDPLSTDMVEQRKELHLQRAGDLNGVRRTCDVFLDLHLGVPSRYQQLTREAREAKSKAQDASQTADARLSELVKEERRADLWQRHAERLERYAERLEKVLAERGVRYPRGVKKMRPTDD